MTGSVRVRVDATAGVRVSAGERVEKGAAIGQKDEEAVFSPCAGVVESVEFDGVRHEFAVTIREEEEG
jgi:Na+-translocating ferredoxin:NAD+ oxidoreductase RnfC subunit